MCYQSEALETQRDGPISELRVAVGYIKHFFVNQSGALLTCSIVGDYDVVRRRLVQVQGAMSPHIKASG